MEGGRSSVRRGMSHEIGSSLMSGRDLCLFVRGSNGVVRLTGWGLTFPAKSRAVGLRSDSRRCAQGFGVWVNPFRRSFLCPSNQGWRQGEIARDDETVRAREITSLPCRWGGGPTSDLDDARPGSWMEGSLQRSISNGVGDEPYSDDIAESQPIKFDDRRIDSKMARDRTSSLASSGGLYATVVCGRCELLR
jgi:hypothetical protein